MYLNKPHETRSSIQQKALDKSQDEGLLPNIKQVRNTGDVKLDIKRATLNNVGLRSRDLSKSRAPVDQRKYIQSDNKGSIYVHPRDQKAWDKLENNQTINAFLPGYATGDRYTAILTMLAEPRLNLTVAYQQGDDNQKKHAEEAVKGVKSALEKNGIKSADRVSLCEYTGKSIKSARESLNTPECRKYFTVVKGNSPLTDSKDNNHIFHVSVTTAIMAKAYENGVSNPEQIRSFMHNMVSDEDKHKIDSIVSDVIKDKGLTKSGCMLWIANRPNANAREAEAISNPRMFEQIIARLKDEGINTFTIADGFRYNRKSEDGKTVTVDRHPYQTDEVQDIGPFWSSHQELKPRENQWYFVDKLLTETDSSLIGIRSGALEPFGLLGHNTIYLEHDDMFTPERHGSWQGRISYNRLLTTQRTGYYDAYTEASHKQSIKSLISENVVQKQALGYGKLPTYQSDRSSLVKQNEIAEKNEKINDGVLLESEIDTLVKMVKDKKTAYQV